MRHRPIIWLCALAALALAAGGAQAAETVATLGRIAGGPAGERGTADGAGDAARFDFPAAISLNGAGSFALIADAQSSTIRRIDLPSRQVSTLAGLAGQRGTADGVGAAARFAYPSGIATSADGSFALIADTDNHSIRRLDLTSGAVTTLAGSPGRAGSADGIGTAARFNAPGALALSVDARFALVADGDNHTIRRVDLASAAVTTVAGSPGVAGSTDGAGAAARFRTPRGLAISLDGLRAAIADSDNHTIRLLDLATGAVSTAAGSAGQAGARDGAGTLARLAFPRGLAFEPGGALLIADFSNSTIRRLDLASGAVTTVFGTAGAAGAADGPGAAARLNFPAAITSAGGTTLIADTYNHGLRQVASATLQEQVFLPVAGRQ
ncbi:MAG: hypothetical protein H7Z42_16265 [Roseiflexaceae bacterium]|nr:hypothetical protein [Roseiflexaceae bacterium]